MKPIHTFVVLAIALGMTSVACVERTVGPTTSGGTSSGGTSVVSSADVNTKANDTATDTENNDETQLAANTVEKATGDAGSSKESSVGPGDWPQWMGSSTRNNTPEGTNIPSEWEVGEFDRETGRWQPETAENIRWVARLGSQSYGNPVIAGGRVYVGTNNGGGHLERYPTTVDLGCLLCFDEADGKFLWQHSSEKLPIGRVNDWELQGICCAPLVEGNRLWFVTSRGEVACLDTEGFHDGENDGPFQAEPNNNQDEADVVWIFNMMTAEGVFEQGVFQHNMCSCSVTALGDILFVCTSNGVDNGHVNLPAPDAPSFFAMDKNTGKVLWTDKSPGTNILHGQWASPSVGVLGGVPQVLFPGGDGWLYSFRADAGTDGAPELLWKFDCNPKTTKWILGGSGKRNNLISTPLLVNDLVYIANGQDPEHGNGSGHLYCIDPTKRGDVSPELAFNVADLSTPIAHRREQAVIEEEGEIARDNPNSALVWHYAEYDQDGDGQASFEESMHRTVSTCVIKDGLLYIADLSGILHCLDAETGQPHWTHDMFAETWGSALVVDGKVYIGNAEGFLFVFRHGKEKELLSELDMGSGVLSSPVVANNVLYIANRKNLFAIVAEDE